MVMMNLYGGGKELIVAIDRKSALEARRVTEKLLPDERIRLVTLRFLADAIACANAIDRSNWNINLDKNSRFIRLNTGHAYCLEVFEDYISVLCLRNNLKSIPDLPVEYKGYRGKKRILSHNLDDVPDCLVRVPGSVGCHIRHQYIVSHVSKMRDANHTFIRAAIRKSILLPGMKKAHSDGMIDYLSSTVEKRIPKPKYMVSEDEYARSKEAVEQAAKQVSDLDLRTQISQYTGLASTTEVIGTRFNRNPYVAEYAKRRAKGVCYDCRQLAPFRTRQTGEPYLEVHHILSLAEGGLDTPENVVALCPNCHRKRHYG